MTKSQPSSLLVADTGPGPRIYLAFFAAYNSGRLLELWVRADQGEDYLWNALRGMIAKSLVSGAEELAIHTYEGFEGASVSESTSFGAVCEFAKFISNRAEIGAKVYNHFGNNVRDAHTAFVDYAREFQTAAEVAEQLHDDIGAQIPTDLRHYIDWLSLAQDIELNGDIFIFELGFETVQIFWVR